MLDFSYAWRILQYLMIQKNNKNHLVLSNLVIVSGTHLMVLFFVEVVIFFYLGKISFLYFFRLISL